MVLFHLQTAKKQKKKKPKKTDNEFNAKFSFTDQVVFSHLVIYQSTVFHIIICYFNTGSIFKASIEMYFNANTCSRYELYTCPVKILLIY